MTPSKTEEFLKSPFFSDINGSWKNIQNFIQNYAKKSFFWYLLNISTWRKEGRLFCRKNPFTIIFSQFFLMLIVPFSSLFISFFRLNLNFKSNCLTKFKVDLSTVAGFPRFFVFLFRLVLFWLFWFATDAGSTVVSLPWNSEGKNLGRFIPII